MSRVLRRKTIETVALVLAVVATSAVFNSSATTAQNRITDRNPWSHVLSSEDGSVRAAFGSAGRGVPLFLTVATTVQEKRIVATTTYVRGKQTLRIERVYDQARGLDVTYSTRSEMVRLLVRQDPSSSETVVEYVFPDGDVRSVWLSPDRKTVSGDIESIQNDLLARCHFIPLLREFSRHRAALRGPISVAGDRYMMRVPSQPCLDECSYDCRYQCAFECAIGPFSCGICNFACAAGCAIGCSSGG